MTIHKIAIRLAELCHTGQYDQAHRELFADNAVSIEPEHAKIFSTVHGLDDIIKKGDQFRNMIEEIHNTYATEPIVAGNFIALGIGIDATMKGKGRTNIEEMALYEVKNGKIVKEQFFY
ncbi:MAG TPA: nuclear transport factor 2 family protein [Chitinophagaceae bacterium]|jgi:limonene-1,2-epoxide hydrolase